MAKEIYRWLKIGGLLSFIPFVLAAGPLAGYFFGGYLEKKFSLPNFVSVIFITIGFFASAKETIKIIRLALKTEEKG